MLTEELLINANDSERATAIFFSSIGLKCIKLNHKLKTSSGNDLGEIDGVFIDEKHEVIFIYDDSTHSNDVNRKISGWFNKWTSPDNLGELINSLSLDSGYRKYVLYIDKNKNSSKRKDLEPIQSSIKENCFVLFKDDFKYFDELSKEINKWCKNDFYNFLNIKPKQLSSKQKTAIQYYIDGTPAFVFSDKVESILEYSYVYRRNIDDKGYQRTLNKSRINKLSKLIDAGKLKSFPNSILINCLDKIETTPLSPEACPGKIEITLPHDFSSCRVVDGQHRLMSFAKANESNQKKYALPIVLFNGMSEEDEIRTFIDINDNQDPIDKNLTIALKSELTWASGSKENLQKVAYKAIAHLMETNNSFKNRIFRGMAFEEKKFERENKITLIAFVNSLIKNKLVAKGGGVVQNDDEENFISISSILDNFYRRLIGHDGANQKYYFSNRGIQLIIRYIGIIHLNIRNKNLKEDYDFYEKTFIQIIPQLITNISKNQGAAGEINTFNTVCDKIDKILNGECIERDLRKLKA